MAEVTMPKLSDTMEEGKILRWLKQEGDRVEAGDLLVEVETDKADMEVEAPSGGVLSEVKLGEGDSAPVGAVIAVIEAGDGASGAKSEKPKGEAKAAKPAKTAEKGEAKAEPAEEKAPRDERSSKRTAAEKSRDDGGDDAGKERDLEQESEDRGDESGADADREEKPRRKEAAPAEEKAPRAASGDRTNGKGESTRADARPSGSSEQRATTARGGQAVKASPLARSLADELGIDLASVRGTGPAGRITRRDVEEAQARGARSNGAAAKDSDRAGGKGSRAPARDADAEAAKEGAAEKERAARSTEDDHGEAGDASAKRGEDTQEPAPQQSTDGVRRVPLSRMRASIAKRMTESKREAPHFYLTTVVDMDEAVRLRGQLKTLEASKSGVTYNHMVIKASADALAVFPEVNARFAGDAIEILDAINIGIATAVDDGLVVTVLQNADELDLLEIAEQARALAEKAESGRFTSSDLSGATFSISNLGMFDVDSFSAVINPPQAAILAVGSVKQRPVVRDGALAVGHTMSMTLSCDHRTIDGARGGRFLAEIKRRLENPAALLLGAGRS